MLGRPEQHHLVHEVEHSACNGVRLSNHGTQILMPLSNGIEDFASIMKLIPLRDSCDLVVQRGLATLRFNVLLDRALSHHVEQSNPCMVMDDPSRGQRKYTRKRPNVNCLRNGMFAPTRILRSTYTAGDQYCWRHVLNDAIVQDTGATYYKSQFC